MVGVFNWGLATPEIVLALCAMAILILGVLRKTDSTFLCTMLGLGALVLTAMLVGATPMGVGYRDLFAVDGFARFMKLLILAGSGLSMVLALDWNEREGIGRFEFPVLILLCTTGMMIMCSASSLMTLYMGLELQSLAIYVMCAFARDDLRSAEAGLKYLRAGRAGVRVAAVWNFADLRVRRDDAIRGVGAGACRRRMRLRQGLWWAWCSSSPGWRSSCRRCRSICGRPTCMRGRRRQ